MTPAKNPPPDDSNMLPDDLWDEDLFRRGLEFLNKKFGPQDTARFMAMLGAMGMQALDDLSDLGITPAEYVLKVSLDGSKPPIWRRISVPNTITLDVFHELLTVVMGWDNTHLHCFTINQEEYGPCEEKTVSEDELWSDESMFRLGELVQTPKSKFKYIYDLGDEWEHTIILEKVIESECLEFPMPKLIDGANAAPPEDSGGLFNYYDKLDALKDSKHPEHKDVKEWWPKKFDPTAFSKAVINEKLKQYCSLLDDDDDEEL